VMARRRARSVPLPAAELTVEEELGEAEAEVAGAKAALGQASERLSRAFAVRDRLQAGVARKQVLQEKIAEFEARADRAEAEIEPKLAEEARLRAEADVIVVGAAIGRIAELDGLIAEAQGRAAFLREAAETALFEGRGPGLIRELERARSEHSDTIHPLFDERDTLLSEDEALGQRRVALLAQADALADEVTTLRRTAAEARRAATEMPEAMRELLMRQRRDAAALRDAPAPKPRELEPHEHVLVQGAGGVAVDLHTGTVYSPDGYPIAHPTR
jgi:chromosome segregation ATPase